MKGLSGAISLIFLASISYGQTITSAQSGPWNQTSTWVGGVVPTSANSTLIDIQHSLSIPNGYSVTVDQVVVAIGGVVTIDVGGTLTVADDGSAASDFDVFNDGIDYGYLTVNGSLVSNNNAAITGADQGNTNFNSGSIYRHLYTTTEGSIPIANWNINSTVQIQGYNTSISATPAGNWSQSFGNFVFDCSNLGAGVVQYNGLLVSVLNDLTISNTGNSTGSARFSSNQNPTIVIGRDLVISGSSRAIFNITGTNATINIGRDFIYSSSNSTTTNSTGKTTINISRDFSMNASGGSLILASGVGSGNGILNIVGNFNLTAGTLTETGSTGQGTINFTLTGVHTFTNTGTISNAINFSVSSLSTLDLGTSAITGLGSFTLNGTLRLGSADPAGALQANTTSGNIQTPVVSRTYSAGSTIVYNGTSAQFIGDGFPSGGDVNLSISNTNGVSLSASLDIVALRTLNLASGNIIIGAQTLTINGTVTGTGGIIGGSSSNLVIGGTGDFGVLTFSGTNELFDLTLNRTGSGLVTLGGDLTILGTFTHTNGTLAVADNILTIAGNYEPTTPAPLSVTISSSIVISGTGTLPSDIAFTGTQLGTLTLNRASSTLPTTSSLTIQNLNLLSGIFDNGSGIAITAGGTITRLGGASGGSMTGSPNNTTDAYNVVYTEGTITSGPELPSNTTALADLSKTGSGTLTLGSNVTVNGTLSLTSGSFNAGTNALDLKGNFVSSAGSTLTSSSITFSGTTVVSGTTAPVFGNITITGSLTPSSNFSINGNLVNNGTLNAGSGTTTFGGVTTISGSSTSSFGTIIISGTLNAPANFNVAGTWTNNGTFNRGVSTNTVTFNGTSSILGSATTNFSGITISGTLTSPATLNVAGNFTNNGTFGAGTGTVVLNGSTAQSIAGTTVTNFNNLTINKSSGTATVTTNQNLTNTLTLSGTGGLNANGRLTLVSTATGDARIAPITGSGTITGNIIAQRYLPNGDGVRAYRYLASPVTGAFVSDWKAEFPITGTFNDPSTQAEWPSISGIVQTSPSMFIYNEAHTPTSTMADRYESYPVNGTSSTASPITNGRGYAAFVRQSAPINLNLTGTPRQGNVPVNVTAQSGGGNDGWNLIGNPYASPINWDNVNKPAAVNAQIALQDNTDNIGLGAGAYVYYTQGGIGIPASYTGSIASGQAFWVRATANATITFEENDKEAVSSPDFIREIPTKDILRVNIAGNSRQDEMVLHFSAAALDAADTEFDAHKLENSYLNLSSFSSDSVKMAINVLGQLSCNKEIGLDVEGVTTGSYTFGFSQFESFPDNIRITLLDQFTGTSFDVREEGPLYEFNVSDDVNSFGKNRFKIYLAYPDLTTDLNVSGEDVCSGTDAVIIIQNSQQGIKYYSTINGSTVSDEVMSNGSDIQLTIPHDKLSEGENAVVLMASVAGCSPVPLQNSVTLKAEKIYFITTTTPGKSCGEGQVSLLAEGAPANGYYNWYETADSASPVAGYNGAEFITPVLSKTETYFVSAVNALGCEGGRIEVVAEVDYLDAVAITINDQQLTSSYSSGNQWFFNGEPIAGATGQNITISETGLYEVEVTVNGCSTRTSQEMIVLGSEHGPGIGYNFYPNPVADKLQIELPEATPARGTVQTSVGAPVGEIIFEFSEGKMRGEFNFVDQAAGLYLIRVLQGNKIVHYKIIKK